MGGPRSPTREDKHPGACQLIPEVSGRVTYHEPAVIPATSARMAFRRSAIWRSSIDSAEVRHRGRELWLVPPDELGECAVLATALLLLVEQGQVVAIEGVEPLLPVDVLQLVLSGTAREVENGAPLGSSLSPCRGRRPVSRHAAPPIGGSRRDRLLFEFQKPSLSLYPMFRINPRAHPLLSEVRAHRQLLERLCGSLNLPDDDQAVGLRGSSRHAQKAARGRWDDNRVQVPIKDAS